MSGTMILRRGRKNLSVARPSGPSSVGGLPTTIDWSSGRRRMVTQSIVSAGNGSCGV
jgi:hypothetical protein